MSSLKKATGRQVLALLRHDPMIIVDAIGLRVEDFQMGWNIDGKKLKISVRPGSKSRVPEKISVVIGDEEFQIDFIVDEDFQDYELRGLKSY